MVEKPLREMLQVGECKLGSEVATVAVERIAGDITK